MTLLSTVPSCASTPKSSAAARRQRRALSSSGRRRGSSRGPTRSAQRRRRAGRCRLRRRKGLRRLRRMTAPAEAERLRRHRRYFRSTQLHTRRRPGRRALFRQWRLCRVLFMLPLRPHRRPLQCPSRRPLLRPQRPHQRPHQCPSRRPLLRPQCLHWRPHLQPRLLLHRKPRRSLRKCQLTSTCANRQRIQTLQSPTR